MESQYYEGNIIEREGKELEIDQVEPMDENDDGMDDWVEIYAHDVNTGESVQFRDRVQGMVGEDDY